MRNTSLLWVALAAMLAPGCGDDGPEGGVADALAEEACTHVAHGATPVEAASEAEDAPAVQLSDGTPYEVTLPASGVGYAAFHSPHEHYDWAFFAGDDAHLESDLVHIESGATAHLSPSAANGACPEEPMVDRRAHMHHMGSFLVEIHGEPGATVWLLILGEPSDHHEGHENGHDHHEGDHDAH